MLEKIILVLHIIIFYNVRFKNQSKKKKKSFVIYAVH